MINTFFSSCSYIDDEYIIIFFPHAGGSSHFYKEAFLKGLNVIPCIFYDKPGNGNRFNEVCINTFEKLMQDVQEFVKPYLNKKIILMGNSMGALIAFKLAASIEKMNKSIHLLIVASAESPEYFERKISQESYWENFDVWLKHIEEMNEMKFRDMHYDTFKFFKFMLNNDFNILKSFKAEKLKISSPIWVFTGNQDYSINSQGIHSWKNYTTHSFHSHLFSGKHFFLINNIEIILQLIINYFSIHNYC